MNTYAAHAKINLSLEILGRRPDGYHNIASVMQPVSVADTLAFAPATELSVETDVPELAGTPGQNLVWRAARILQEARQVRQGVRITLHKGIPLAAGLGGGSSDAALTLRVLDHLWDLRLSEPELLNAARLLGADVAFFLRGGTALVEGIGERVTALPALAPCGIVLVTPPIVLPEKTRTLYAALRFYEHSNGALTRHLVDAVREGTLPGPALLYNGFEAAAFRLFPELDAIQATIVAAGGEFVRLSGSGPSLFVLYPTVEEAAALCARLVAAGLPARVVTPITPQLPWP